MNKLFITICILISSPAFADGLLGDVTSDLGRIATEARSFSPAISRDVYKASVKIERAALSQAIQEDALTMRIAALEQVVEKQKQIISHYEKLVADLEAKVTNVNQ